MKRHIWDFRRLLRGGVLTAPLRKQKQQHENATRAIDVEKLKQKLEKLNCRTGMFLQMKFSELKKSSSIILTG